MKEEKKKEQTACGAECSTEAFLIIATTIINLVTWIIAILVLLLK